MKKDINGNDIKIKYFYDDKKGNRKYRRTLAAQARDKRFDLKCNADLVAAKSSESRAKKLKTRIEKAHARKLERLANKEANNDFISVKKHKISPAELKQIKKRAKKIKFANKHK